MKRLFLFICLLQAGLIHAQTLSWSGFADSIANLSSPRATDLNNDGIKDIVFGGAADGIASHNGIVAVNGQNGQLLWRTYARNEVFGSAIFRDITGDNIPDVFISGRQAQLLAINGSNGQLIWDFFPYPVNPADSGWYNFYNPQFIPDQNNDGTPDLLVANGGDHSAPVWDTLRPAGRLMIINTLTGGIISQAVVPDSAEIYCSPVVLDLQNNGSLWILYGTGGETLGGHFYACPLTQLAAGTLAGSTVLASDSQLGYIAPASYCTSLNGNKKVFIQSYGGTVHCIDGASLSTLWTYTKPNTESSSAIVIGNFTGDLEPDAFATMYKGTAPSFTDFYQILLDGANGNAVFTDSIGTFHFASGNAFDYNNDGRDEALISVSDNASGAFRNKLYLIDFVQNQIQQIGPSVSGVNLASTPLVMDLEGDNDLDLVFLTKHDSINPSGVKGVKIQALDLGAGLPNSGLAWASYMGSKYDGAYEYRPSNCGTSGVSNSAFIIAPTCNGLSDGSLTPVVNPAFGPHTYVWSTGSTDSSLTGIAAGTYSVRITNSQNCYEDISYNLPEAYTVTFGGVIPPTCPGDTNGIAALNSTGCVCMFNTCVFEWSNGVTTMNNSQLPEGWNSVTITHPGGCVVVDSVFVPSPAPVVSAVQIQPPVCHGDSNAVISIQGNSAFGPHTVTWWNGIQDLSMDSLPAGSYSALVQDIRACRDSIEILVTDPAPLNLIANAYNMPCYNMQGGSIEMEINGGVPPYSFMLNGNPAGVLTDSLPAGNYMVTCIDSAGCIADTSGLIIIMPDALTASYTITPEQSPVSLSGIAIAHAQGGTPPYTYLWNDPNGQTDSMAVYLSTGWYVVQITDANGCMFEDSVFVPVLTGVEESNIAGISVYPNPARDEIRISESAEQMILWNVSGQILLQENRSNRMYIGSLDAGIYLLEIKTGQGIFRKQVRKI